MGRGRAKAKQTKVARDLKYRTIETDFEQLQREMQEQAGTRQPSSSEEDDDYVDYYDGENSSRS